MWALLYNIVYGDHDLPIHPHSSVTVSSWPNLIWTAKNIESYLSRGGVICETWVHKSIKSIHECIISTQVDQMFPSRMRVMCEWGPSSFACSTYDIPERLVNETTSGTKHKITGEDGSNVLVVQFRKGSTTDPWIKGRGAVEERWEKIITVTLQWDE